MPDSLAVSASQPANPAEPVVLHDRRRPGRLQNPSPELIALMRRPSDEAVRRVALYDAPNFVPPAPPPDRIDLVQFARFAAAFAICAAAWTAMFKMMMMAWG